MEKIIIEIHNPEDKAEQKLRAVVEALSKALKVPAEVAHNHTEKTEPTPYPALQELSDILRDQVRAGLQRVLTEITTKWLRLDVAKGMGDHFDEFRKAVGDDPFILNGTTYINPSTGQALTRAEWEVIAHDLDSVFGYLFGEVEQSLVLRAMALGKILQGMPVEDQISKTYTDLKPAVDAEVKKLTADEVYRNIRDFSEVHTGELIQDISDSARRAVVSSILDAQKNRLTARETERKLFDTFSTLNRDWRRIAETETATNFNNGYLVAEKVTSPDEFVFMRGVSGPGACTFCATHINGRIVVLLDAAPSGGDDTIEVDGTRYTAIWPGKNNFGRKAREWWVAAGTQHPHCRCTWTRYTPGMKKYYDMLDAAMAKQAGA